jgi:hypothetical protein
MDGDWILMGIVIGCFLYLSGYRSVSIALILLLAVIFMASALSRKPIEAPRASNVLEPIIIESTRGAPYTIPDEMQIFYDRKAKPRKKWESIESKWGKGVGRIIKKIKD